MTARLEHYHSAGYWEWIRVFQHLPLSPTVKVTGYALALSADFETGHNAHPGLARLMEQTGLRSDKAVRKALAELRRMHLIDRQFRGSSAGRRGLADMYWLALHDEARIAGGKKPCDCESRGQAAEQQRRDAWG